MFESCDSMRFTSLDNASKNELSAFTVRFDTLEADKSEEEGIESSSIIVND